MFLNDNSINDFKNLLWNSQRCQRNWDLTKTIPSEDIELMVHACKSSPSKQNEPHFRVYGIENFDLRKKIYNETLNFAHDSDGVSLCFNKDGSINYKRQSQLMGNFLFVFCRDKGNIYRSGESYCGSEFLEEDKNVPYAGTVDLSTAEKKKKVQDKYNAMGLHAIGISVGYLLITAHMLGYKTGCSSGFDADIVTEITGHPRPEIIVAVGYSDETRNRREEHFERGRLFPSWNKDIKFEIIK
jgi:nitroreductase